MTLSPISLGTQDLFLMFLACDTVLYALLGNFKVHTVLCVHSKQRKHKVSVLANKADIYPVPSLGAVAPFPDIEYIH